jgi:hypothetical protein
MKRDAGPANTAHVRERWLPQGLWRRPACLALALTLVTTAVAAFVLTGVSWPSKQITMRTGGLDSGGNCGGNCQSLALAAMDNWNAYCNPDPDFTWNRSTQSCTSTSSSFDGINCTDFENLGQCSSGTVTLGVTYVWFVGSETVETDVSMNSRCSFSSSQFRGVLGHEDGHVMGLDHSQHSSALMAASYVGTDVPQGDDCNGARAIYGSAYTLTVSKSGTGTVTSDPPGIDCGSSCSAKFPADSVVILDPTPGAGWEFSGWSGNADCSDGEVTMNSNISCAATFARVDYPLTVSTVGSGDVTSSPPGIDCPGTCSASYPSATAVTLTPGADPDWMFTGWSGDSDCTDGTLTMNGTRSCTATFTGLHELTITKSGTGSGTVKSSPPDIDCGASCAGEYLEGTPVLLTGTPSIGSELTSWTGDVDCSDGQVTMSSPRTCNAVFNTCSGQSEVSRQDEMVTTKETWAACNNLTIGPNVQVSATGELIVYAGNLVTFDNGVVFDPDAKLSVFVGQPMRPP